MSALDKIYMAAVAADWQIVTLLPNGVVEVDVNSGQHRRVWFTGEIELLDEPRRAA